MSRAKRGFGSRVGAGVGAILALLGLVSCSDIGTPDRSAPDTAAVAAGVSEEVDTNAHATGSPDPTLPFDRSIEGGLVLDGTGAPGRLADLLIRDGRVVYVGPLDPDTLQIAERQRVDGLVVAPGFIDAHAHGSPESDPDFHSFLAQGVTTILLGQDGSSPTAASLSSHMDAIDASGAGVNLAWLAGHNTLRGESGLGFAAGEDPDALRPMIRLVERALDAGAFGVSLGLEYSPGRAAGPEELAAIGRAVAERDGVIMAHLRTEDRGRIAGAVDELLEIRRRSGARVHVSHLKVVLGSDPAEADLVLERMEATRVETGTSAGRRPAGGGVTADLYPYLASFTGLSILFPDWARSPNDYAQVRANRGDELATYLRERVESRNGPAATLFATGPWAGLTLAEAAEADGRPFEQLLVELGPRGARAAYFVMDAAVMERFLADPRVAVASDGSPTMGHPRGYGSFARVIREHVVEGGTLELEEAVRKMTSLPSAIIGLDDSTRVAVPRGRIAPGWAADLVAFDPAEVRDRADFQDPHRFAVGMAHVWVNGVPSWRTDPNAGVAGAPVGSPAAGRVLRDR